MTTRVDEIRSLLTGTELAKRQVIDLQVLGTDEWAYAIEIGPTEVLDAWHVARDRVERSRRWPVVVACWGNGRGSWEDRMRGEDLFNRFYFREVGSEVDSAPRAITERAGDIDPQVFLEATREANPALLEDIWADAEVPDASHLDWFEPNGQPVALLLLPCRHGWESLAYLHWYAAVGSDAAPFVALLHYWADRYGAELVAHFGTMLEFVVHRPPASEQAAAQLAREQLIAAPSTALSAGVTLADHARALVGLDRWFLHERP